MKILVYSDVHGNLPAFEKMLKTIDNCDGYICLGDLVNYGPWSNDCVDLALSLPHSIILMGNHEEAFINGHYPGSNELVKLFFLHTYPGFKRVEQIKSFRPEYTLDKFICTHTIQNKYIYQDTGVLLDNNYFIGHSHQQFTYQNNGFFLFNPGSVGQNRKHINMANYLLYYPETGKVEMQQAPFDFQLLLNQMKVLKYPDACINYYKSKMQLL